MARQKITHAYYAFASYIIREGHLYEVFLVLAEARLIKDQVLRAVLKQEAYFRRNVPFIRKVLVLFKTRPI